MFSTITGEHNPVRTDEEFAKNTVFGGRILHGPAAFAIATGLESRLGIKEGTAVAFLGMTWDTCGPVKIGDTIHVYGEGDVEAGNEKAERGYRQLLRGDP
jgi:acyl dehydratase